MASFHDIKGKINLPLAEDLDTNKENIEELFEDASDVVKREFPVGIHHDVRVYLVYVDLMIDRRLIDQQIVQPLMQISRIAPPAPKEMKESIYDWLINGSIVTNDMKEVDTMDAAVLAILSGDAALFIDGYEKAVVIATKGWPNRGIQTPDAETVIRGPKEGFSEAIRMNTVLIRRRIRDTRLKFKALQLGRRSRTDTAIAYIEGIVKPSLVEEVEKRMAEIDIDGILESGYVEQMIEDNWWSPFPQVQTTQRPDKVAASLLEGKAAIIIDNTPFVMIVPATLNGFLQTTEDYYERWFIMSFVRMIRYLAAFISIALPALYIAVTTFHPAMIPTELALAIASAREGVPFPAVVEVLLMELTFELLREAGTRLPAPIGSTIGIVGGLVIGQAAVTAGIVSPIIVIIVATTAISSFAIPNYSLTVGFRMFKFLIIVTAGIAGLYGWILGLLIGLIHVTGLKSFGTQYLSPFTNAEMSEYDELKDSILRVPLFMMKKRPFTAREDNRIRMKTKGSGRRN